MAYIAKVKATSNWSKLEDLIKALDGMSGFAFDADTTYQIQAEGLASVLRLCDGASAPTDSLDGNYIVGPQPAFYKKSAGNNLYVRADVGNIDSMLIKVSSVGE